MRVNRSIIYLLLVLAFPGCIEPFSPLIEEERVLLVVDGTLTDQEGYHQVRISRSGSYSEPEYLPERWCQVTIRDSDGNSVVMPESEPGLYEAFFEQSFLTRNTAYHIHIRTEDGKEYVSEPDSLLPCPPVDTLYYEQEIRETYDPEYPHYGIRFYTDLHLQGKDARNYRWDLEETWEYRAAYLIQYYWVGRLIDLGHEVDSLMYCWKTEKIRAIHTISAENIEGKEVRRIPLTYVSNQSNRLKVKYSLLVTQYALSTAAYQYWNQMEKQNQESGGLYETQPARIRGNIRNVSDPDERVLGFFNVSSVTRRRIFVEESFQFHIEDFDCRLLPIDQSNPLGFYRASDYPVYLIETGASGGARFSMAEDFCFDCREGGGTTEKPDFWE
jgi:hypothetical protein